ncbi:MAG: hypothetical protein E6G92_07205 [Alphaproteobacteria bacterium]|nr:MAG: hypothetical protein E6G92_07205 [Alphaproteobacteria bacterium]
MARGKVKAEHRADTRGAGFAGIPISVIKSEAYRHLNPMARCVLVEIVARLNGYNNGQIGLSFKELAHALNRKNEACFAPAIAELIKCGLVDVGLEAKWKQRLARTYRLTFVNTTDSIGRPIKATNEYLDWTPEAQIDATDAVAGEPRAATAFVASRVAAATNAVADTDGKLPRTPAGPATDGVVLISKPYPGTGTEPKFSEENGGKIAGGPSASRKAAV